MAVKMCDLHIPFGSSHLSTPLALVSITPHFFFFGVCVLLCVWKELILAGSLASVGNRGLWPNASPSSTGHLSLRTNTNHRSLGEEGGRGDERPALE